MAVRRDNVISITLLKKTILMKNGPFSFVYIITIVCCIIESSIHDWYVIFNNNVFEPSFTIIIYKLSTQLLASRVSYGTDSYNTLRSTEVRITQNRSKRENLPKTWRGVRMNDILI